MGRAISVSRRISPGAFIPISRIATRCASFQRKIVSGSPIRLLKFPSVLRTLPRLPATAAVISFVVDLPLLPVIATHGAVSFARQLDATSPSARSVSATSTAAIPAGSFVPRCTTTPPAPAACASPTKSCPSKCAPRIATKRSPAVSFRVSIVTAAKDRSPDPDAIRPPVAAAIS